MDRKSIILLVVAVVLLLCWTPLVDHIFPPKPVPAQPALLTNSLSTNVAAPSNVPQPAAEAPAPPPAPVVSSPMSEPSQPERILSLTSGNLIFNFTSHGGGLKTVAVRGYPAVISRTHETDLTTNLATLNRSAPVPVLALLGKDAQGDNYFDLTQRGSSVIAAKTLANGLRLVKEFNTSTDYLFTASVRLENTTASPLTIPERELVIGTATPIGPLDDPTALGTFWYNGIKAQSIKQAWFANRTLGCIPGTPRTVYQEGASNVVWAAVHNQFFTLAAIPATPAPQVVIHPVMIPVPVADGLSNNTTPMLTNGQETAFVYPAVVLAPHQVLSNDFTFYAGPKKYNLLAHIGDRMGNNLDQIMNFTGFTGFFSKGLLTAMNILHDSLSLGYGWTIIAITIIIKIAFWPLTRAATRSQKRMQALQPQLNAISEKYKDDPVKKNQKTMDFMKEHKVSPLGSCLPTVIQIPVFFGFYYMLRNAIELRGVHFLWARDLSQPDTVAYLPILGAFPLNPLPIIMGATQLWQSHLLPPSPGMEPGQQKMMRYMPLMFVAMFYRMSAGLTLYWTISNLLSILQTKMTKMTDDPALAPASTGPKKKV